MNSGYGIGGNRLHNQMTATRMYQEQIASVFADLAELFGNPRSYGSIYGILFSSSKALTLVEISECLDLSSGATSQGLNQLEAFGAIIRTRPQDSTRDLFTAKLELRHLIAGFLNGRVIPRLESTETKVHRAQEMLANLDPDTASAATDRLARLARWHSKARTLIPIAKKILDAT